MTEFQPALSIRYEGFRIVDIGVISKFWDPIQPRCAITHPSTLESPYSDANR